MPDLENTQQQENSQTQQQQVSDVKVGVENEGRVEALPAKANEELSDFIADDGDITKTVPAPDNWDDVNANMFQAAKRGVVLPVEEPKKEDQEASQQPIQQQGVKPVVENQAAQELQGFDEPTQKLLKKMAPDARQFVVARLRELGEEKKQRGELKTSYDALVAGKPQIPQSYFENENAYLLLPEYQQAVQASSRASEIAQHWKNQLALVRAGKPFYNLQDVVDAKGQHTGQYKQIKVEIPADVDAHAQLEADIIDQLNFARQQAQQYQQAEMQYRVGFQQRVLETKGRIGAVEEKFFPKEKWEKEGSFEKKAVDHFRTEVKNATGITEVNPAFNLLAKSAAKIYMLEEALANALKGNQVKQGIAEDKVKAGPSGSRTVSGGGTGKPVNVTNGDGSINWEGTSVTDFSRAMRGGNYGR